MLDNSILKSIAFNYDLNTLVAYAYNAADIILYGKPCALYDFAHMDMNGRSVASYMASYAIKRISDDSSGFKSDLTNMIQADEHSLMVLGALQNLCVAYKQDSEGLLSKMLCTGNYSAFKTIVDSNSLVDVTDTKISNAERRLTIPTQKAYESKKAKNVIAEICNNKPADKNYCGPIMEFVALNKNQEFMLSFKNSNGLPLSSTLFVPLSFLYIVADIFTLLMGGTINYANVIEKTVIQNIMDKFKNCSVIKAAWLYTIRDRQNLVAELAQCSDTLTNWGKRVCNKPRGVTMNKNFIYYTYGKKAAKSYQDKNGYCRNKIAAGEKKIGLSLPEFDIFFYDIRSEATSTEPVAFNPINFRGIRTYTKADYDKTSETIQQSAKYPKIIMQSVYMDCMDNIFDKKRAGLDKLWKLTSVKEELLDKLYSKEHYDFMMGSLKRYSATDIYEIVSEVPSLFSDKDHHSFFDLCAIKVKQMGLARTKLEEVALPTLDGSESPEEVKEKKLLRRKIIASNVNQGICIVDYKNVKGSGTYRKYVTNNKEILTRLYGKDYIGKYAAIPYCIQSLEYILRSRQIKTTDELYCILQDLGINDIAGNTFPIGPKGANYTFDIIPVLGPNDFELLYSAVKKFIDNYNIMRGNKEETAEDGQNNEKKPVPCVNVLMPQKIFERKKDGNSKFNVWLYEYGVDKLYIYK